MTLDCRPVERSPVSLAFFGRIEALGNRLAEQEPYTEAQHYRLRIIV